ncbi:hypothetical protein RFI_12147 [Reticulomyxa filosa]|uniref:DNA/RNA-binding protein Alba-like domain-containing protein n=1 Tax=Reticulomyxa filosa TaxID=46433 RepID=X6NI25_RETFI|nr:hypothetical protein RFI_12147 [Reticulomyxa filosa]|eukprot:ETO24997.1 hypothetical protein RFI_12147 [Reticulomyxa filosa]
MAQPEPTFIDNMQTKYRRKPNPSDQPSIEENEVRITTQVVTTHVFLVNTNTSGGAGGIGVGASGGTGGSQQGNEEKANLDQRGDVLNTSNKQFDTIVLKATGQAIYSAVTTAEVVKRRIADLHQVTSLDTLEMIDVWEPLEEGLKEVKTTRRVASITIKLSRKPLEEESHAVGYQEPIPAESIGGRGRGTRGGRGRGRGRGRGFSGRGGRGSGFGGGGRSAGFGGGGYGVSGGGGAAIDPGYGAGGPIRPSAGRAAGGPGRATGGFGGRGGRGVGGSTGFGGPAGGGGGGRAGRAGRTGRGRGGRAGRAFHGTAMGRPIGPGNPAVTRHYENVDESNQ